MSMVTSIRLWLRALLAPQRVERDLDREMRFHLEMEAEKNRRAGMSRAEAARVARVDFGGVERYKEAVRDERGVRLLDDLVSDIRYALRGLRRTPTFTASAILVLGLGIGAATAVFTVVDHVLWRALPFPQADRLTFLTEKTKTGDAMLTSFPNFDDWRQRAHAFSGMAALMPVWDEPVVAGTETLRAQTQLVSREFFQVFGVTPLLGRAILPGENARGGPPVAVVSERFWQQVLGGSRDLRSLRVKRAGGDYDVVGVMPASFRVTQDVDIWVAAEREPVMIRGAGNYWVVGRLAPDVTLPTARREMDAIAASLKRSHGDESISDAVFLQPFLERVVTGVRRPLLLLLAAAAFVLVVTCVSVAMMQLARSSSREREIGIRTALGAGRLRLLRQLSTEQLTLALFGCGAGVLVAWTSIAGVRRFDVSVLPRLDEVRVDPGMLIVAMAATACATLLFGAAPVLRLLARPSTATARSLRARMRQGPGTVLVGAQAAVTVLLFVGAALLVRSIYNVLTVDLGYDRHGLVSVNIPLFAKRYERASERVAGAQRLRDALAGVPGVEQVALASQLPSEVGGNRGPILVPPFGDPNAQRSWATIASLRVITPNYFATLRTRLLRGRMLEDADREPSGAVVINRSLADKLWPGKDPLGRQLRALVDRRGDTLTVVGVVDDARDWRSEAGQQQELYLTTWQRPEFGWQIIAVLRTRGDPQSIVAEAQRRVRAVDPELAPVARTFEESVSESIADRRFVASVLIAFAGVVLVLTIAGVVGSVSYAVERRTRELGIRMALGASGRDVWLLVQRGVLTSAAFGAIVGVALSLEAGSLVRGLLYGITPRDPVALVAAAALTTLAILLSAAIPALRASRIDPAVAVRAE